METHQVNSSSSALKQFQIEGNWAPVTPIKPSLTRPTYHHGSGGLLPPPYLREISIQNQPQSLLSCSINSPEIRSNPNGINNYWDAQNSPSIGSTILRRENVGELGSLAQGALSSPRPISWDLPLPMNDGVRENVGQFDTSYDESFAQFNGMSFGDLLALKDSVLDSSVVSTRLGNNGGGMKSTLNPTWAPQTLEYQDMTFCGLNLLSNGVRGGEMQNGAFTRLCNANSSPSIQQSKGKVSTFVPLTPDLRWRVDSTAASAGKTLETDQTPHKQNNKDEAAAVQTNLPEINNKEVLGSLAESSPGNADIVGEENHNLDKVGEQGIDLNKMPQKKPRRKRYTPKVVNENKPKRTPKPSTSKPTESKEATTKVKRKYVRKNKTNPSSMATPAEATDKTDPKPKGVVKSCRRSLNFDLNGQEAENDSLLVSEPQAKYNAVGNQSSHSVHIGQGEGSTVEASQVGIACDLNHTLHREPKNNISLAAIDNLEGLCHDQAIPAGGKEVTVGSLSGSNAEVSSRTGTLPVQRPNSSSCASSREGVQIRGSKREHSSIRDLTYIDTGNMAAYNCTFWPLNPTSLGCINNHGVPSIAIPEVCKKKRTGNGQSSHPSSSSSVAASKNVSQVHSTVNHPGVNPSTSKYYYSNPATFGGNAVAINQAAIIMRNAQNRMQLLNTWADITRLKKKKRLKGATRGRDMSEMKGIASIAPATPAAKCPRISMVETPSKPYPYPYSCSSNHTNQSQTVHSSMEALTGETHTTPRSKRGARKQSSSMRSTKHWDIVLYDGKQSVRKTAGNRYPESKVSFTNISGRWINSFSLEAITEGLKHLDINREGSEVSRREQNAIVPYDMNNREKNAIVPYKQDGTIVPFEGPFEPLKKRRQRAKVDLDDETTKVWRLLLENIDNQGINGTDEEKVKWWENERSVFQGRVDSFIARMRLVQGDRRFTPWKGSVLDSVIGVFLTQNVSDHLSSSAFMSLVARFPVKFECNESTFPEEEMSAVVVEPEVIVVEPEESITWKEKASDPPVCNGNSRIIHEIDCGEEKEAVNSNEQVGSGTESVFPTEYSCESTQKGITESRVNKANSPTTDTEGASILGDDKARDDATSSQQSVISFQNSISSPNLQTLGFLTASPETNSRAQASIMSSQCYDFEHSTSFIGLLKMAESPLLHESYGQLPRQDRLENTEAPSTSSNVYQSHLQMDFHLRATKYIDMLDAESRSSETSRKDENSPIEQSNLTTESTIKHLGKEKTCDGIRRASAEKISSSYVLEGEKMVVHSQEQSMKTQLDHVASSAKEITSLAWKTPTVPNAPQETADVVESSTGFVRTNEYQKETEQTSNHSGASTGVIDVPTPNPSKSKSRAAKEKRSDYDWDSLRREALANGKIKERTANTRDSLDWEALRSADVSEIADTIKARGMNNMLAQRIKDLLDRLVREHGSCDLEWLRDIPPDKAKEYLLSFRGLGLKSVECVRLLTLHHLAFPVDTNVGRIAVRLGWVPLQPLPESLQLHLLEMYPVLESIQKYLWPRLCRLDQKTLYELHYHLITFGKVFCTKRQPNCNACPLRGECRHFASAFASARLALPGPEERSIMPSNGDTQTGLHPQANFNPLPLPPFLGSQHPEEKSRSNIDASVIGVPSAPLSLPLPSNHSEKKSEIKSCEPIVEVPASPEPETDPEQEQTLCDIEDTFYEDPDEIPMIKLNMKQFSQTLENFMQANREVQVAEMSKALVALTPDAASIPTPKLKNISRLRTEHHVYELPDTHPLLKGLDKREPDDPCSYLLAIWTPGETANSIEPPERRCSFEDPSMLCNEVTCSYCSSQREANSQIVRGTLLIPCRTAMRGSFPLNGTYFQVNEVFADHDSSMKPMEVPRSWLWNLPRRTVYFGTSVPTIFRGLNTEEIQHCFWRGYVCVRGFDKKTRSPRPLMARLHFPASKMPRGAKGKAYGDDE